MRVGAGMAGGLETGKLPRATSLDAHRRQIQKFLDEWHLLMLESGSAQGWDRRRTLRAALDVLELNGVRLPSKEALFDVDDGALVERILEGMPATTREHFPTISRGLLAMLEELAATRQRLEQAQGDAAVRELCKLGEDSKATQALLKLSVVQACSEISSAQAIHASWRCKTEERIARLGDEAREADDTRLGLEEAERQLAAFAPATRARAARCVTRLVEGQDLASLVPLLLAWSTAAQGSRRRRVVSERFDTELQAAKDKLLDFRATQVASARAVLGRSRVEDHRAVLRRCMETWRATIAEMMRHGEVSARVLELQARLTSSQSRQAENMKRVMTRIGDENLLDLTSLSFQGWSLVWTEARGDRGVRVQQLAAEVRAEVAWAGKRVAVATALEGLSSIASDNALACSFHSWFRRAREERKLRQLARAVKEVTMMRARLSERQSQNASEVQWRTNCALREFDLLRCFSAWAMQSRVRQLQRSVARQIDMKKRQLNGVQTLFKTFANQLEVGLAVEEQQDQRHHHQQQHRTGGGHHEKPLVGPPLHRDRGDPKSGMRGSASLPSIHERPVVC